MRKRKTLFAYMLMFPALLILAIFTFYPMIYGILLSFFDYNMLRHTPEGNLAPPQWVGISNFKLVFKDHHFHIALKNSIMYLLIVPVIQIFAIFIAFLVNRKIKGIDIFKTAFYIPVITSIVIVGIAWKWVFASDGILNFILVKKLGLFSNPIPWLADRNIALFSVMFVTMWQGIGYYMVLYLAGLQGIPKEFEEAALLDGANTWHVLWKITIPLLKPTIALCVIISCISALKVFGEIYVMTGGGPENGTLTMVYYIFTKAFNEFNMGYASALALVLSIFVAIISYINIAFFKEGGLKYY